MKLKSLSLAISTALLAGGLLASQAATAQGRLVVYFMRNYHESLR